MKVDLVASKPMTYATRRLVAGDAFQASPRDARVLKAIGKARDPDLAEGAEPAPAPQKAPKPKTPPADERVALRAEYKAVTGKNPFNGWDAATLKAKIADAQAKG